MCSFPCLYDHGETFPVQLLLAQVLRLSDGDQLTYDKCMEWTGNKQCWLKRLKVRFSLLQHNLVHSDWRNRVTAHLLYSSLLDFWVISTFAINHAVTSNYSGFRSLHEYYLTLPSYYANWEQIFLIAQRSVNSKDHPLASGKSQMWASWVEAPCSEVSHLRMCNDH